jgi:hypothetical protein
VRTPVLWILDPDGCPIPFLGSVVTWAQWMGDHRGWIRVGDTVVPHRGHGIRISTVFLGTATRWPPFETMVFAAGTELHLREFRSATRAEAEVAHRETVACVRLWVEAHP